MRDSNPLHNIVTCGRGRACRCWGWGRERKPSRRRRHLRAPSPLGLLKREPGVDHECTGRKGDTNHLENYAMRHAMRCPQVREGRMAEDGPRVRRPPAMPEEALPEPMTYFINSQIVPPWFFRCARHPTPQMAAAESFVGRDPRDPPFHIASWEICG